MRAARGFQSRGWRLISLITRRVTLTGQHTPGDSRPSPGLADPATRSSRRRPGAGVLDEASPSPRSATAADAHSRSRAARRHGRGPLWTRRRSAIVWAWLWPPRPAGRSSPRDSAPRRATARQRGAGTPRPVRSRRPPRAGSDQRSRARQRCRGLIYRPRLASGNRSTRRRSGEGFESCGSARVLPGAVRPITRSTSSGRRPRSHPSRFLGFRASSSRARGASKTLDLCSPRDRRVIVGGRSMPITQPHPEGRDYGA